MSMGQKLKLTLDIDDKRVHDLLVSALEGGSNYWYMIEDEIMPTSVTFKDPLWDSDREKDPDFVHQEEIPFCEGGALMITDAAMYDDQSERILKKPFRLDRKAIEKGLQVMANLKEGEGGHHFPNFLKGDDDSETGDVFLQCCVFGELVYG